MLQVMRSGTHSFLLLALMWGLAPGLHASPLKTPKRIVSEHTVDLTPLFHWWTNHAGARPLASWSHVTGNIVGTNGTAWVVEASVDSHAGGAHHRVLLRHPPLQDRADFEQLSTRLKALNEQRAKLSGEQTQAKHEANSLTSHAPNSRVARREARLLKQEAKAANGDLNTLDKQIKDVRGKLAAFPSEDHYVVDCFALNTGEQSAAGAVYDHGLVLK